MAVYANGIETKRLLVTATLKALEKQDASTIKVRDIAAECDVSPATVYRHFDSMEELISVAAVGMLDEYSSEYRELLDSGKDIMEIYVEGWELFNRHAFARPDIYYLLFWGKANSVFESATLDYYKIFPFSGPDKFQIQFYLFFFSDTMQERDYTVLRTAANMGRIMREDAEFLSKTNSLFAKALLSEARDADERQRKVLEEECNSLIRENVERANIPDGKGKNKQ